MLEFNGIGFLEDKEVIGAVAIVNWLEEKVTLVTDNDEQVEGSIHDLVLLHYIGEFGDYNVFNHDVFITDKQDRLEVELQQNGNILLHQLDSNLERVKSGREMSMEQLLNQSIF